VTPTTTGTDPTNLGNIYAIVVCATTSTYHCPLNQDLSPGCFIGDANFVLAFVDGLSTNVGKIRSFFIMLFLSFLPALIAACLLNCSATLRGLHLACCGRALRRGSQDLCDSWRWLHPHTAPDLRVDIWLGNLQRADSEHHCLRLRDSDADSHRDIDDGICEQHLHADSRF